MIPQQLRLLDSVGTPLLLLLLFILFASQLRWRLREQILPVYRHAITNALLAMPSAVILRLAVLPAAWFAGTWSELNQFGLLWKLSLPSWIEYSLGFVILDCTFYYWHILNHRVPLLWRFHNVHHIDLDLDISTAFRFHFGEMIFSIAFRALQVALFGIPMNLFLFYEILFQACTEFHHSNLRLPISIERRLVKWIVTPRMHGIHHSMVQTETDSNFSVVLSVWDRMHRTIRLNVPQQEIRIGIPAYQDPSEQKPFRLLFLPFRKQREYWKSFDGTMPVRDMSETEKRDFLCE
jgi:sterol desaturase/sphingolipid hydroxylase (fatty acid hydroxylase superfamily)